MKETTKRTVTIVTIIISLSPCLLLLHYPAKPTIASVTLWVSAIVGYMGIVLLLWMYILGTKSTMSLIYGDLAPVLKIHKWLGRYGTIAIFLHPILITLSYGESWLYSVIPQTTTVADRHILLGQISFWIVIATWALSAFLRGKIAFRPWKYLHYLAYICVPFALLHVPDLGSQESQCVGVKAYFFALVLTYLVFVLLKARSLFNLDKTAYIISRHVKVTDEDYMVQLTPQGSRHLAPKCGQYVYIKLGFFSEDHPFTVTQYDGETHEITLVYRMAGMYTKEFVKLRQYDRVFLSGPYGTFTSDLAPTDSRPVAYISGGVGITPFFDRIMSESSACEQWLFAVNRTKSLAVLYEPLRQRLGSRAVAIYSRDQSDMGANEEHGYITYDLLQKYLADPTRYQYYICGPQRMIDSMTSMLMSNGVARGSVHSEVFAW